MEILKITPQQSHALTSFFWNNIDWVYLSTNFNLSWMVDLIGRNEDLVGGLFTEIIIHTDFVENVDKTRKKNKGTLIESELRKTFEISGLLDKNIRWSLIDFKEHEIQKRIIGNPFGVGQKSTDFLINLITNQELGLV